MSVLAGGATVFLNLILLWLGWGFLLRKKFVALAAPLVVIKYAILGIIIYQLMRQPWLSPVFFLAGVSTLLASILVTLTRRTHGV